jgi:hypothetical protein
MRLTSRFSVCLAVALAAVTAAAAQRGACSITVAPRVDGDHTVWEVSGTGFAPGHSVRVTAVNQAAGQSVKLVATTTASGFDGVFLGKSAEGGYVGLAPGTWKVRVRSGGCVARTTFVVPSPTALAPGEWGGEHMHLVASESGGVADFDCAHGRLDEPISTDADGAFDVSGVYVREHGGPIRQGEREDSHPAGYSGQVKGDTMTVTIVLVDTHETIGTFTLRRGSVGVVVKGA